MAVTPEQVGVEIGVPTPSDSQTAQWQTWIDQAYYLIERRYGADYSNPSTADADYVVLMVVAAHARHPDNSTQVDVSVDDASMSRRYTTSAGRVTLDDWWDFLDPDPTTGGAFTITPYGEPDVAYADVAFDWRAALATDD
jgi:hypothetical protein